MDSYRFQQLLQKLSRGTLLPEEDSQLRQAMEQLSAEELEKLFPAANQEAVPPSLEEMADSVTAFNTVWQQMQREESKPPVISITRSWWRSGWVRAACLAGIIILSVGLYIQRQRSNSEQPQTKQVLAWQQTSTRKGERRILTLPDGTLIYLNGNSTLRYPANFDDTVRQVELVAGEIFLEVHSDEVKPFLVKTGEVKVQVLGTSFSVRNKKEEQQVSVAVKTGKVNVGIATGSNADYLMLTPGEKGVFEKKEGSLQQTSCTISNIGGWTKGEFEFEDATLHEILTALQDSYGYSYSIHAPMLANRRFRASFRGQTPADIVRILSKMGDFNYSIKDSTIIIQ